jgi:hypothetical protein
MSSTQVATRTSSARRYLSSRVGRVVKRRKPAGSPVTRIGPVQNQFVRPRILDSAGQNEDASEDTYDGLRLKPTGMMARDRGPRPSRFAQLIESLQNRGSLVRCIFCHGLKNRCAYGWIGQQLSSGFCDRPRLALGVFASSDRF